MEGWLSGFRIPSLMPPFPTPFRFILLTLFLGALLPAQAADSGPRQRTSLDDAWKFNLGDMANAQNPDFNDIAWRNVTLPHDWSIAGPFDAKAPMGGAGGFLPAGIGWYRRQLDIPAALTGRHFSVEFEGVYMNADVWLNGQHLATHPYGYTSFNVDLTPAIKFDGPNVLAVRVDNSEQKNSRWYSGSGIYRHVWLTATGPVHVTPWGVCISVPQATADAATVVVQTEVANDGTAAGNVQVSTTLVSSTGSEIGKMDSNCAVAAGGTQQVSQQVQLAHPALWTPATPGLTQAVTTVSEGGQVIDRVTTPFGVRSLTWNSKQGLLLNGTPVKLNGGCIHDDNGVLGTAAFDRAEERKIELLKAAGFNEIRTAHAPPSPEELAVCDRLGMLVMEDSFDCWLTGKNSQDYHIHFKDWWQRDLDSMVLRDRNHPSIIFWNIGNEIPNVYSPMGVDYTHKLVDEIHSLDKTRPVTNAILNWPHPDQVPFAVADWDAEDIVGTNYALGQHIKHHADHPNYTVVSTESSPGDPFNGWSSVTSNDFVVGDNVWSAEDYLGECGVGRWFYAGDPTEPIHPPDPRNPSLIKPISHGDDRLFPWHGANCGDFDILGNRKPMSHWRNVVWNDGEKLYLAVRQPEADKKVIIAGWGWYPTWESWTWPGWEGKPLEVEVYSRYDKVRLYLNDKVIGENPTTDKEHFRAVFKLPYQPGTLKAVGLQDGNEAESCELATADAPAAIRLTPDRTTLHADGQDLSFVKAEVLDKNGKLQPDADEAVSFTVTGKGTIAGLGNADLKSLDPYQGTACHFFHGVAQIVLRATDEAGAIGLQAHADGLTDATASLQSQAATP